MASHTIKCETCVSYEWYKVLVSGKAYHYNDAPCCKCVHYCTWIKDNYQTHSAEKIATLERAGFFYHLETCTYVSKSLRKAFSSMAVEEYPIEHIKACIDIPNIEWTLYFKEDVSHSVYAQLVSKYDSS